MNKTNLDEVYINLNIPKETEIIIHFVSNYYIEKSILDLAQDDLKKEITNNIQPNDYTIKEVIIDTTFEIFCKILKVEKNKNQGKRYGHSITDIVREINRYMNPNVNFKDSKIEEPKNDYTLKLISIFKEELCKALS
jgi:hypothetical protein